LAKALHRVVVLSPACRHGVMKTEVVVNIYRPDLFLTI